MPGVAAGLQHQNQRLRLSRLNSSTQGLTAALSDLPSNRQSMTPEAIKTARLKAVLSPAQAARVCHVHIRTWWRWELGEVKMPRATWELFTLLTEAPKQTEANS